MTTPQHIGRYQVLESAGTGGFATVYRAQDPQLNRVIALKVLHPHMAVNPQYLQRFLREARLAASINHPNVVTIHEVGQEANSHFIAMEYLPASLEGQLQPGGLPISQALELTRQVALGLQAAHQQGVVHRDLKPANILLTPDGTPKVTDFGIARAAELSNMTASGMVLGTPNYMSPEQAQGQRVDARSDLYSLGCVLYQMLTGVLPFESATPYEVIRQHIEAAPRPLRQLRPEIPAAVEQLVSRCLEKDPNRRYRSAAQLAQAIEGLLSQGQGSARQQPVVGVAPPLGATEIGGRTGKVGRSERIGWTGGHRWWLAAVGVVLLVGVLGGLVGAATMRSGNEGQAGLTEASSSGVTVNDMDVQTLATNVMPPAPTFTSTPLLAAAAGVPSSGIGSAGGQVAQPNPTFTPSPADTPVPQIPVLLASFPQGGHIAFVSERDGHSDIYLMDADGSNVTRLTISGSGEEYSPSYSPTWSSDGSRIAIIETMAYDSRGYIAVINADASEGGYMLTNNWENNYSPDYSPAWSPDGSRIAFVSYQYEKEEIYVMNADGSEVTNLTNNRAPDYDPAWSPDGSRIVFSSDRSGNGDIYVMNADGSGVTSITNSPAHDYDPAWSPDGSRIAFSSDRSGNYDIHVMNADGSGVTSITNNPSRDDDPAWSPDGSLLAFSSDRSGNRDIYVMNADGSGVTSITNNPADDYEPAWSPAAFR